jgi:hypothetical protein
MQLRILQLIEVAAAGQDPSCAEIFSSALTSVGFKLKQTSRKGRKSTVLFFIPHDGDDEISPQSVLPIG